MKRNMITAGALLCTTVVAAMLAAKSQPVVRQVDRSPDPDLETCVRARATAWITGDNHTYQRYTSPKFLLNGAPPRDSLAPLIPDARPFEISNVEVVTYPRAAVVTYTLTEYLNYEEGAPFDRRIRMETWVREKGTWKAAAGSATDNCASNTGRWLCY